ncbi:hexosaminidase [Microbacterium sp. SORGH_AS428]|uniref:family 20 glycosylhydrolase n=1 Tax=Microbacterium sp. SORGH_AS_0428 TaxID=3041788 RepID=UPI002866670B|nr:family 20 glycosylhydrolase [Microbacterium sp. SORGH_AS_0428]MDR6199169.1 hexosaminidase [Microbacterium sp. SORGH_AS_0428]
MSTGLVPRPTSVTLGDGAFVLTDAVSVTGDTDAVALLLERLHRRTARMLPAAPDAPIRLRIDGEGAAESYRLVIDADTVELTASDAAGLQHGVHTLLQLVAPTRQGWVWPAVVIDDAPRFAHRGLMLDVARHFFAADVVERLLDRMAELKLNALHLHLSDDQGWRLALDSRPRLAERASDSAALGDAGGCYSRVDWQRILDAAASRHITVIPEFDVPGHTHAVGLAYPGIAQAPVVSAELEQTAAQFGGGLPVAGQAYTGFGVGFSSLRIGDAETSAFLRDVFTELAELTPGPYLHIGGDEALGTSRDDYDAAIAEVTALVSSLGKTPVAWHEAGAAAHLTPGTIGQYWGFVHPVDGADEKARGFVERGGRLILSPADAVYLDMKDSADSPQGLTWANGPTPLRRAYDWEPAEVVSGIREEQILGVEAALWTETIRSEHDIQQMAFPRLAAAAEVAWSAGASRSWESFRERLADLATRWDADGLAYRRIDDVPWRRP